MGRKESNQTNKMSGRFLTSWVEPVLSRGLKCLAQRRNTVPMVSIEPATLDRKSKALPLSHRVPP